MLTNCMTVFKMGHKEIGRETGTDSFTLCDLTDKDLERHIGHDISCKRHGNYVNVVCDTCKGVVLLSSYGK